MDWSELHMTAREAHKAQWEKLKDKPLKDKLIHILTYYWAPILGVICVISIAVSWIGNVLFQKEVLLAGYLINATANSSYSGNLTQEFMERQQIDSNEYNVRLTANAYYSNTDISQGSIQILESIVVQIAAGDLDFIVTDLETYPFLSAYYGDLREVFTEEQLKKYRSSFVYVEKEALDYLLDSKFETTVVLPTYYLDPTDLQNPIPLGIRLPESCRMTEAYTFHKGDVILGVVHSSTNIEQLIAFLDFITT